ncbi:hypothetical protein M885DRAFT_622846 [Pelagophyceae sp. CCMP2097]|nr:hypothetical protein M885DRAFT_622846 [Pelagophyceae sp. CCMP2097]
MRTLAVVLLGLVLLAAFDAWFVLRRLHADRGDAPKRPAAGPAFEPPAEAFAPMVAAPGELVIAHVINPMPARHNGHSDQDITFASLARAAQYARARGIRVVQFTAEFGDDPRGPRPATFGETEPLTRHVYELFDMAQRRNEAGLNLTLRKLPLLSDILERAYSATASLQPNSTDACADPPTVRERGDVLIVYSNNDIGVQEAFYESLSGYAALGLDAFVINRVEVPEAGADGVKFTAANLTELWALGKKMRQTHSGYDMFVWRRELTPALQLYSRAVFVGYPPVGKHLRDGLACCAPVGHFAEIHGEHHTFHVGDRNGGWSVQTEYEHYNRKASRFATADFGFLLGGHRYVRDALEVRAKSQFAACVAARSGRVGPKSAECRIVSEIEAQSFLRWDNPGTDWPPQRMDLNNRSKLMRRPDLNRSKLTRRPSR